MTSVFNYEDGYFCQHFDEDLGNGQHIRFTFQDMTWDVDYTNEKLCKVWNCSVLVYDEDKYYETMARVYANGEILATGLSPLKSAVMGMRMFKNGVEELRELNPECKTVIFCGWLDEHRHSVYAKFLSKLGYSHHEVDGEMNLVREYTPLDPVEYALIMSQMEQE